MPINPAAPVISRHSITIDAPVEVIWALQTDVDAWPQWRGDVDSAHLDGPFTAGATFRWQTAGLAITSTVTQVERHHHLEWGGPASGITAVHVWRFEAGGDRVQVSTEESWEGAPIDAAVDQMQHALDDSLHEWLQRLKEFSELAAAHSDAGPSAVARPRRHA